MTLSDIQINNNSFGAVAAAGDSLVIELSASGIQFCELNSEKNTLLFVGNHPSDPNTNSSLKDHLISGLKHFQLSKKSYNHVMVNYFDQQFTLVPVNFYQPENLRSLLEFNVGHVADKLIITDDINADIKLIYAIDETLKSTLDSLFPNHQLKHTLTVLSKLMLSTEELVKENILLTIHVNHIEIIVKQDHKLILANQFSIKTQEDILYYILFVLEQYQLNPLFVNISVAGNIDSNAPLMTSLKKYVKQIHLATGHRSINWENVKGMPQHFNYSLVNRLFCE